MVGKDAEDRQILPVRVRVERRPTCGGTVALRVAPAKDQGTVPIAAAGDTI